MFFNYKLLFGILVRYFGIRLVDILKTAVAGGAPEAPGVSAHLRWIVRFFNILRPQNQEFEAFSENLQSFSFWANRKIKYIFFCGWKQKQKYLK